MIKSTGKYLFEKLIQLWSWIQQLYRKTKNKLIKTGNQAKYKVHSFRRRFLKKDPNTFYYRVFGKDAYLQQVDFLKPDRVLFQQVDLANVYFRGTNLRGARFLDANWWQKRLGRNGLYDEVFTLDCTDGPVNHRSLPSLEETYRNIRVALEENRSFAIAPDFYIGEMEAQRRQLSFFSRHFFSVTAWYNALSRYGTRPYKAARFLFFLGVLHFSLTALIQKVPTTDVVETMAVVESYVAYTIGIFSLIKENYPICNTEPLNQFILDVIFRIFGAFQMALLVLSLRTSIKRH